MSNEFNVPSLIENMTTQSEIWQLLNLKYDMTDMSKRTSRVRGDFDDSCELDNRAEKYGLSLCRRRRPRCRVSAAGRRSVRRHGGEVDDGQLAQVESRQLVRVRERAADGRRVEHRGGRVRGGGGAALEEHEVALEHEQQVVRPVLALALRVVLLVRPQTAPVDVRVVQQRQLAEVQAAVLLEIRARLERAVVQPATGAQVHGSVNLNLTI